MGKSPEPPPEPPLPDDITSSGLEPDWIDPLVGSEEAYDRQLFAGLVDEMVPKLKRTLIRSVLPSAKNLAQIGDGSSLNATRFQRLPGLLAGSDHLENMESLDDLNAPEDPEVTEVTDELTPGAAAVELTKALDVAGLSAESDATRFAKAFGKWCRRWHLYNRWQHVAALQTLVSMTQVNSETLRRSHATGGVDRSGHLWGGQKRALFWAGANSIGLKSNGREW